MAITTFAARRYPLDRNRSELLLGLHNQGQRAARVELTLLGDGQPIDVRSFELAPGAREQRVYDDLAFAGAQRPGLLGRDVGRAPDDRIAGAFDDERRGRRLGGAASRSGRPRRRWAR